MAIIFELIKTAIVSFFSNLPLILSKNSFSYLHSEDNDSIDNASFKNQEEKNFSNTEDNNSILYAKNFNEDMGGSTLTSGEDPFPPQDANPLKGLSDEKLKEELKLHKSQLEEDIQLKANGDKKGKKREMGLDQNQFVSVKYVINSIEEELNSRGINVMENTEIPQAGPSHSVVDRQPGTSKMAILKLGEGSTRNIYERLPDEPQTIEATKNQVSQTVNEDSNENKKCS